MEVLILILAVLPAALATEDGCLACINGLCHYKEQIGEGTTSALYTLAVDKVLAVDYAAKIIYCQFQSHKYMTYEPPYIGYWENGRIVKLSGTSTLADFICPYGCTVDQNSHDVYAVCTHGVFKFNPNSTSQEPEILIHRINSIGLTSLQYRNTLYLSDYKGVFTFGEYLPHVFFNVFQYGDVREFVVDKNHDIYFNNNNDKILKFDSKTSNITYVNAGDFLLSVDQNGDVYLNTDKKLYKVVNGEVDEIGYFNFGKRFKAVFDWNNNILFVDSNKLYVLKPSNTIHCTYKNDKIKVDL